MIWDAPASKLQAVLDATTLPSLEARLRDCGAIACSGNEPDIVLRDFLAAFVDIVDPVRLAALFE